VALLAKEPLANRVGAPFAISHDPGGEPEWLELLASGLTFDLSGLVPGPGESPPPRVTSIGLDLDDRAENLTAIRLLPGPHLAGGEAVLPIVRVHLALAATLSGLPHVAAVAWHPARTWIEPDYFGRIVGAWLDGGVFPALGLTALLAAQDGGLQTEGLNFFVGRELRVPVGLVASEAETAKLAMRLIHHIVEAGKEAATGSYVTEQGLELEVRESDDDGYLEVCRSEE